MSGLYSQDVTDVSFIPNVRLMKKRNLPNYDRLSCYDRLPEGRKIHVGDFSLQIMSII